ncbi:LysR family transcriptional regulator [Sneathiella chinensis]|uniref:LysR family transcriptional regulator n=2 Tax=Sneathiella chinensis TaxID=349750 RepID=A0ABQ5U3A9_9PROT|nr:LysR family transcriptional regulator [Sneathiella chinensis]
MAAFVAVAEQGSFSQAGRELRVSTAVVSARIAKLEADIGVRLLNRTTRQVSLTEEARGYYQDCKDILQQVEQAEAALSSRQNNPSGSLKIAVPVVFGRRYVAPLLPGFVGRYPDIDIRLHLADSFVDILKEGMDVAIRIASLRDSTLMARKLADSPRVICAAPSYLDRFGTPQVPADLLQHQCLLLRFPGSVQFQWRFQENGNRITLPVQGRLDSNNGDVIRDWALAGHGICMKSRWEVARELASGELVELLPETPPLPVGVYALYSPAATLPPRIRLFIDYLVEAFKPGIG